MTQLFRPDDERAPNERPVAAVAPDRLAVTTSVGSGVAPLYVSCDWGIAQPKVRRVVIVIHGRLRNADAYFELARQARAAAGGDAEDTLLIVPQFLAAADVAAHGLAPDTMHWEWIGWMGGDGALGPAPLSSFDVLDAILERLARRDRFPSLETVVIAGHSGGGQVVQRYAVVTRGESRMTDQGIALRYVIANPSSYVYFDELRPTADGEFAPFDAARCPGFNDWKYGLNRLPAYAREMATNTSAQALEYAYARRSVTVLLGSDDCDPAHPALDKSCAAQTQGAHRLQRGLAYERYMRMRHPSLDHRTLIVDGFGHDGKGIFTSPCGLAVLFG
ncbi:alpha/beta hydrolase [Trinickia dinghuensis]|uniref:Alpha/beta hydrolase n=1 Tax=Trinickia dinghuensis TaxID=2291023 RepID=A0A3D8JS20_9BURK|nr:alpha/beta hydrolase [Trinickia dinghuensis]RDU95476.1 alpha/beta hydrolase [Trinickia dinghuensis]